MNTKNIKILFLIGLNINTSYSSDNSSDNSNLSYNSDLPTYLISSFVIGTTGRILKSMLPDFTTGRILNSMLPDFSEFTKATLLTFFTGIVVYNIFSFKTKKEIEKEIEKEKKIEKEIEIKQGIKQGINNRINNQATETTQKLNIKNIENQQKIQELQAKVSQLDRKSTTNKRTTS